MENNPLSLIIKEKTLGSLVTNAKDIKAYVEEKLKEYSVDNYPGDAKQAAKDKAEINSSIKMLNDRRIELEKEWNQPFQEFKDIITETCTMMKTASGKLDAIVKAKEEEEKAAKRVNIENLWAAKQFNLVTLERVFNPKWLNKTVKLSAVDAEIDCIIKKINGDLASLDAFGEDTAILKDLYLSTLDLQVTLNKGAELKANRERLAELEAKKAAAAESIAEPETVENTIESEPEQIETTEVHEYVEEEPEPVREDISKLTDMICGIAPSVPLYCFSILGSTEVVDSVKSIAEEVGLITVPGITFKGNIKQVETFKALLIDNGLHYDKTGAPVLSVRREK